LNYPLDSLNIRYQEKQRYCMGKVRLMANSAMAKEEVGKEKILAAIRRAAEELGRAPSRGELRRITGVSHYRVLSEFPTLREAVRAAGLEPNPKGEKISTEDLLADWKRVAEKLGRRPSRTEYVREGKYSAGALTVRFGSWGNISTTEDTENHREKKAIHRGGAETRRKKRSGDLVIGTSGNRKTKSARALTKAAERNHKGHEEARRRDFKGEMTVQGFTATLRARVPAPVVGMRRVTEAVAQMVVNTLMGARSGDLVIGTSGDRLEIEALQKRAAGQALGNGNTRKVRKDRPVMGEPFDRSPMTNAPVNELGVMVLFGMVAAGLGLQVESVQGKFPDCMAKRQVAPGKWQHLRIEFEYESKNFKLHGHDPKGCDMIVCWRHNWKECPAEIEVVELSRLFGM
jgi:hypothetical protein